jgi:hypothetical protein
VTSLEFASALSLAFVVQKLLGAIDWQWWQVFIPLYVVGGIQLVFCIIFAVVAWVFNK